jgi:hypothetical protein
VGDLWGMRYAMAETQDRCCSTEVVLVFSACARTARFRQLECFRLAHAACCAARNLRNLRAVSRAVQVTVGGYRAKSMYITSIALSTDLDAINFEPRCLLYNAETIYIRDQSRYSREEKK